ncbi:MAG TPA: GAF domain-containing protein [Firmicutes bacterium]|nr:GAF domain-containing protein [Bacillota bacterium]
MDRTSFYNKLNQDLTALIGDETDAVANLANASSLLFSRLPDLNWAGFYLLKGGELVIGPFQGKPACIRIAVGKGVCGTAVAEKRTILVPDVHEFAGHIVCDPDSRSEIVVPIISEEKVRGVLDIDSPKLNRFDDVDQNGLEQFVQILETRILWEQITD